MRCSVFISYSAHDRVVAMQLVRFLREHDYEGVFVDVDPETGIPAGQEWEQDLYRHLRETQAVLVLCSPHSMASQWVFAEIALARAYGKTLIPILSADCTLTPQILDRQVVDLRSGDDAGRQQLLRGLVEAGVDPSGTRQWRAIRPPYPGLDSFLDVDEAVFCGRRSDITACVDSLNRARRYRKRALVVLHGASGVGKSSLVRAGVLPRVKRDGRLWLVLRPLRTGGRFIEALVKALEEEVRTLSTAEEALKELTALREAVDSGGSIADAWDDVVDKLRQLLGRPEATPIVTIDQFEELLPGTSTAPTIDADVSAGQPAPTPPPDITGLTESSPTASLCDLLKHSRHPLVVLATLRSDLIDRLEAALAGTDLSPEFFHLAALSRQSLVEVIEGPASIANMQLAPGLSALLVDDARDGEALPLLAFALRELWEACVTAGRIRKEDYHSLMPGGLTKAIADFADREIPATLPAEDAAALKSAILALVHIGADGRYTKRPARWDSIPSEAHPWLQRLVTARLLVSGTAPNSIELAHEALLTHWPRAVKWISENREFLLWRQRFSEAFVLWAKTGAPDARDDGRLLHAAALSEALHWLAESRGELLGEEQDFIKQSVEKASRERAEREETQRERLKSVERLAVAERQRANEQARAARSLARQRRWLLTAVAAAIGLGLVSTYAFIQARNRAIEASRTAALSDLGRADALGTTGHSSEALAHIARALRLNVDLPTLDAVGYNRLFKPPPMLRGEWTGVHTDKDRVETVSSDGILVLVDDLRQRLSWIDTVTGARGQWTPPAELKSPWIWVAPDGRHLLVTAENASPQLWDLVSGRPQGMALADAGPVKLAVFSGDSTLVMTAANDKRVRMWHVPGGAREVALDLSADGVRALTAGEYPSVLGVAPNGAINVWSVDEKNQWSRRGLSLSISDKDTVALSPTGQYILVERPDQWLIWDSLRNELVRRFERQANRVARFGDGDVLVVSGGAEKTLDLFDLSSRGLKQIPVSNGSEQVATSVAARVLAISGSFLDGRVTILSPDDPQAAEEVQVESWISYLVMSPSGDRLYVGRQDGSLLAWSIEKSQQRLLVELEKSNVFGNTAIEDIWFGAADAIVAREGLGGILTFRPGMAKAQRVGPDWNCTDLAVRPTDAGMRAVFSCPDGSVSLWDLDRSVSLGTPVAGGIEPELADISSDGETILVKWSNGLTHVLNGRTGTAVSPPMQLSGDVHAVSVNSMGAIVLETPKPDASGRARLVNVGAPTGEKLLDLVPKQPKFSPDGKMLASIDANELVLRNTSNARILVRRDLGRVEFDHLAFNRAGTLLALWGSGGAQVYNVQDGRPAGPRMRSGTGLSDFPFSGDWLAGVRNGSEILDAKFGIQVAHLPTLGSSNYRTAVAIDRSGTTLGVAHRSELQFWRLQPRTMSRAIRGVLADFAEAIAGYRLDQSGDLSPLKADELTAIRSRLLETASVDSTLVTLARNLFGSSTDRSPTSPR